MGQNTKSSAGLSEAASKQDAAWADWVDRCRQDSSIPFEQHWARYNEIFKGRAAVDGPPIAWRPSPEAIASSNLGRLMAKQGSIDYADLHAWSVSHRPEFWEATIDRMGIVFSQCPDEVLDQGSGVEDPRWLPGAQMNCVDSVFTVDHDRTAIVSANEDEEGLATMSYGELESLVHRVARGLAEHGFVPGDRIALYMPMTAECVAAYLGIVHAGCCVVSIADSYSSVEVARRLEIAQANAIITVDEYLRGGKAIDLYSKVVEADACRAIVVPRTGSAPQLRTGDVLWDEFLAGPGRVDSIAAAPDTPINVLFSSGTTGAPKAIPWTHLSPIKCAMDGMMHQDIGPDDVVAWPTNVGWMMGPWLIFASLINGAAIALHSGAPNGPEFAHFVKAAGVSILGLVPALVRAWRSADLIGFGEWDGVRVFSSTGEPSNAEDYLWLMSRTGYRAPVIEYLGGTEIGGGHITGSVVQPASPATFTTPALGIDFVILDEEERPVAEGATGELYLVPPSIGLSQRLLNRDHDEVYFAGCPAGPNGQVLRRHGDRITRLHNGFYRAAGRADDTMNLGGIKVGSLDIEQVLDSHTAVRECAAVGVNVEGEGAERLVLFVCLSRDADPEQLKRELGRLLATGLNPLFKIHDLVIVPELPRTASNKLMRRSLRDQYHVSA